MRLVLSLAILLSSPCLLPAQTHTLLGAWKLYSYDYNGQTKHIDTTELKMYTERNFVWINCRAGGEVASAGGGTYTYADPEVIEHLDYTTRGKEGLRGVSEHILIKFQDADTYIATTMLKNQAGQRLQITEVWKRDR